MLCVTETCVRTGLGQSRISCQRNKEDEEEEASPKRRRRSHRRRLHDTDSAEAVATATANNSMAETDRSIAQSLSPTASEEGQEEGADPAVSGDDESGREAGPAGRDPETGTRAESEGEDEKKIGEEEEEEEDEEHEEPEAVALQKDENRREVSMTTTLPASTGNRRVVEPRSRQRRGRQNGRAEEVKRRRAL
ncbi:hypothetical protein ANANG_G00310770 [Anguilla anguilla]|uniref:Uncharacterized protein n=1 Tax=Anguilla anguilla TaxID=7936 RepID=A0A9D3LIF0_ANGAN|nr:hypothetical protein ANANG_G00310770 [Anguilla anguilla]